MSNVNVPRELGRRRRTTVPARLLLVLAGLTLVSTSLAPSTLAAQTSGASSVAVGEVEDPGRWIGVALGGAGIRLTCDLCDPSRELGPAVELSVGSYARPDLRVGLEVGGWTHDDDGSRESVYRAGVVAHLRPRYDSGLYLVGGFGWTRYSAGVFRYDAPRVSLGAGWELPFGGNLRVGNQLTLDASGFGAIENGEHEVARTVGLSLVRLSIQIYRM